jgi:hypothetical protein
MAETISSPIDSAGTLPARPFSLHGHVGIHTTPIGGGWVSAGSSGASPSLPGDAMADYIALIANLIQAGSTTDDQAARLVQEMIKTSSRVHAIVSESLTDVVAIMRPPPLPSAG